MRRRRKRKKTLPSVRVSRTQPQARLANFGDDPVVAWHQAQASLTTFDYLAYYFGDHLTPRAKAALKAWGNATPCL